MKASANKAADATQRAAKKTKLEAEIGMNQSSISSAKQQMGLDLYDAMKAGDQNKVAEVFGATKGDE